MRWEDEEWMSAPRNDEIVRVVREALYDYAVTYLREEGGTESEAFSAADSALLDAAGVARAPVNLWRSPTRPEPKPTVIRRLSADIEKIQAEVTTRICTGEKLWISGGKGRVWHMVATPTRAMCGSAINSDDKAWALRPEPPEPSDDYNRGFPGQPADSRCQRCAKL